MPHAIGRDSDARGARLAVGVAAREFGEAHAGPSRRRILLISRRRRLSREGGPFVERHRPARDDHIGLRKNCARDSDGLPAFAVEGKALQNLDRVRSGLEDVRFWRRADEPRSSRWECAAPRRRSSPAQRESCRGSPAPAPAARRGRSRAARRYRRGVLPEGVFFALVMRASARSWRRLSDIANAPCVYSFAPAKGIV